MSLNAAPTLDITNATLWPNPTNAATNYRNQSTNQLNTITNYITSNIVNKLNATTNGGGAAEIGCTNVATGSGNTIYSNLQFTYAAAVNAVAGSITNDTLTEAMMAAEMKKATNGVAPYNTMAAMQKVYIAGGTATALTVNTGYFTGVNNQMFTFIAASNNSAANTTIAADSVNAAPLYKANTTNAPTPVVGKAYSVWYNSTNVCFFVKASAGGTAVAGNVLAGTTFSNDNDTGISGTLTVPTITAGDIDNYNDTTVNTMTGSSYVKKNDVEMTLAGTFRIKFKMKTSSGGQAFGQLYKNGGVVGTLRNTLLTTYVEYTEDLTLAIGDNIQLYVANTDPAYTSTTTDFKICTSSGSIFTVVL